VEGDRGRKLGREGQEAGELGEIMQRCAIFRNRKNAEAVANKNTAGTGINGKGSRKLKPSCSLPPPSPLNSERHFVEVSLRSSRHVCN